MKFYKYQGAGNDFILVDNRHSEAGAKGSRSCYRNSILPESKKGDAARKMCDRRFGIGGDGLLLIETSKKADVKMRFFNPDGTEPGMCGNGIRCFAKHVYDSGIVGKRQILIETPAGVKKVELTVENKKVKYVKVDMGEPVILNLNQSIEVDRRKFSFSSAYTGVPHVIIFVENLDSLDVQSLGRAIRYDKRFPGGTNVNFVQKTGENKFKIRTYERGVEGETLACGTGVAACGAVAVALGRADAARSIEFKAKGGTLFAEVEKKKVYMRGPAKFVFEGRIDDSF